MGKIIRLFEEADRQGIRKICADTGFLGEPIDSIFKDRDLFSKMIIDSYLDLEPHHTIVGEVDGNVVAYVMGAANPNFERKLKFHVAKYSAKMLINMFLGRYNDHPRSKEYVRWFFTKGLNEVPKVPEGMPHVHINIDRNYRGDVLIGYKMLTKLEDILRKEGAKEYYGRVFVSDKRTLKSYERYGFKEYDRKELTAFKKEMNGESIYKVTIVKSLVS